MALAGWRIDRTHSNIEQVWADLDGRDWPTGDQWDELRRRNILDEYAPAAEIGTEDGVAAIRFSLPMPGVSFLRVEPERRPPH